MKDKIKWYDKDSNFRWTCLFLVIGGAVTAITAGAYYKWEVSCCGLVVFICGICGIARPNY
jgi:hypothetical protein